MAAASWFAVDQANRINFSAVADEAVRRISDRVESHILLIRSTGAFFAASGRVVSRTELARYVEELRLSDAYAGVQGIGFARLVPAQPDGDSAVSAEIGGNYGVDVTPWPPTDQPDRAVVTMLEPATDRNLIAMGYDMYANSARRSAMDLAVKTGSVQASGRVELVQNQSQPKQAGFLIYSPFYGPQGGKPGARPIGFVYSPFRANDLFSVALNRSPDLPIRITIYDTTASEQNLLFRSEGMTAVDAEQYKVSTTLPVAGRRWIIEARPSPDYVPPADQSRSYILAIVSILLAAALALSSRAQQQAVMVGEDLQKQTQKNLNDRELLLQEMKHRIKNMIARVMAMARQTARNSADIDQFTTSFIARLDAMATSQDLLARSKWQRADLRTLLVQELRQVFGEGLDETRLSGPAVQLNEAATQAFGLTFHELATNGLKYGFARNADGELSVRWVFETAGNDSNLVLNWTERCENEIPETQAVVGGRAGGFGTRLIDATMRIELGGTIERNLGPRGLTVAITVPVKKIQPGT
ncbi:CHASE domain-containing protein [Hoeflea marina]|nr:CHASE domain-containing protein [Hoeflea marina]